MGLIPIEEEYNINYLTALLKDSNYRYVFIYRDLDERALNPVYPFVKENLKTWVRNSGNVYSLENDLQISTHHIEHQIIFEFC